MAKTKKADICLVLPVLFWLRHRPGTCSFTNFCSSIPKSGEIHEISPDKTITIRMLIYFFFAGGAPGLGLSASLAFFTNL